MTSPRVDDLKQALADARAGLLIAIAGISESQFKQRPPATASDPQPWCIAEVLAHLLTGHGLFVRFCLVALDHDGAVIDDLSKEDRAAAAQAGRSAPVPQLIHGLQAARRDIDRVIDLAAVTERGFERTAKHGRWGPDTVDWMIEGAMIDHEREHTKQIEALRVAVGATALGAAT